jgi:hypothetical protein
VSRFSRRPVGAPGPLTARQKKSERELHVAPVDGQYRYFIDCGTPLMRQ